MKWNMRFGFSRRDIVNSILNDRATPTLAHRFTRREVLWVLKKGEGGAHLACHLIRLKSGFGWGEAQLLEGGDNRRVDCPLRFLDRARTVDAEWRRNVILHHVQQATARTRQRDPLVTEAPSAKFRLPTTAAEQSADLAHTEQALAAARASFDVTAAARQRLRDLIERQALLRRAIGCAFAPVVVVMPDATILVERCGDPLEPLPPAYRHIIRFDIPEWQIRHPDEPPIKIDVAELGYRFRGSSNDLYAAPDPQLFKQ